MRNIPSQYLGQVKVLIKRADVQADLGLFFFSDTPMDLPLLRTDGMSFHLKQLMFPLVRVFMDM